MGTQLESIATSGVENFFPTPRQHSAGRNHQDEEQLIHDGNAQVLKNIEARKKKGDYSRSQTSRNTKEPSLNMNSVDWSGFPGAAHKKNPSPTSTEKKSERRSSLQQTRGVEIGTHKRIGGQGHLKLSLDVSSRDHCRSLSPQASPMVKSKFRSRRRVCKMAAAGVPAAPDSENADEKKQKEGPMAASGLKARAERRSSGSNIPRTTLRISIPLNATSSNQSKTRNRRPQTAAQRQSLSPSAVLRSYHSTSPTGRLRRPVAAAASSTTLEVSKAIPNRNRSLGSSSRGRRKKDHKQATDVDDGPLFQKASSFRW